MSKNIEDNIDKQAIVLIITGPCGSGKSTIANLIVQNNNFVLISGDDIKNELFPEIENITDYPEALEKVYTEIYHRAWKNFMCDKNIVIDYIVLGQKRIDDYKKAFLKNIKITVLLPRKEIIIRRDKERECWTSGEECIIALYNDFNKLMDYIGAENYIDNSEETPEETYMKYFALLGS